MHCIEFKGLVRDIGTRKGIPYIKSERTDSIWVNAANLNEAMAKLSNDREHGMQRIAQFVPTGRMNQLSSLWLTNTQALKS